jgi:hypothetical protein
MNLDADDYQTKAVVKADLLASRARYPAIDAAFKLNFHLAVELEEEVLSPPAAYRSARRFIGPL